MKYEEIKNLLDNGFTKEEIMSIINKEDTPGGAVPASDPAPEDPTPDPEPASGDPQPLPDLAAKFNEAIEKFGSKMDDVLKEIQAANIMNSSQKGGGDDQTAEDILAQVILPPVDKK